MKTTKTILIFIMSLLLLTGCSGGGGNSRPSNKQILSDIQESFSAYYTEEYNFNFPMSVTDFETELSETEEKTYTASLIVITKSTYADFFWPAEVTYKKYDQGWAMADCSWGEYTYEQVRYPNDKEIDQMLIDANLQNTKKISISHEPEKIVYRCSTEANWSKYASGKATSIVTWEYYMGNDQWVYDGTETASGSFTISKNLEGKWALQDEEDGYMIIENVTDIGFDITIKSLYYDISSAHFNLDKGSIEWFGEGRINLILSAEGIKFDASNQRDGSNKKPVSGKASLSMVFPMPETSSTEDIHFSLTITNYSSHGDDFYLSFVRNQSSKIS